MGYRLKSSPHDPYILGHTRVTKAETKSSKYESKSKSLKSV